MLIYVIFLKNALFNLKHKIHFINFEIKTRPHGPGISCIIYFVLRRPNNNNDPNAANNPPNNVALFEPLFSLPVSGNAFALL